MSKYKGLIVLFAVVLTMQFLLGILIYYNFDGWSDRGSFGDMFGAVNTLFSGLAFAGLIYANVMQSKELSLQREELELQRNELELTRQELGKSAAAQQEQVSLMLHSAKVTAISNKLNAQTMLYTNHLAIPGYGAERPEKTLLNSFKELQELINIDA
jgi:hypothetical protein